MYFITKKSIKLSDIIIVGSLLGISFMIRYQAVLVFFAFLIFLLIYNKKIHRNFSHIILMGVFFLVFSSPLIIYNYETHGTILDSNGNYILSQSSKFQTSEWHNQMEHFVVTEQGTTAGIFLDFDLFLKNYFYNLFYHNPDRLFSFGILDNISIIPLIPFAGLIPAVGGLIYCLKLNLNKTNLAILLSIPPITTFFVFLLGDISIHFFAIIIIPLVALGIVNIRNIQKNLLPAFYNEEPFASGSLTSLALFELSPCLAHSGGTDVDCGPQELSAKGGSSPVAVTDPLSP